MSLIDMLQHLQSIDQEWDLKAQRYQVVSAHLGDQSPLEERRRSHQALADELAAMRHRLRDGELEFTSVQERARETEHALYSGRVTSPKELENLHRDLDGLRRRATALEDAVLEAMARVEELTDEAERDAAALQAFEEDWARERGALLEEYRALRTRLKAIQDERAQLRAQLDSAALRLYDELRAKKGGQALSPLRDRICQTCRVTQPSHKVQVVTAGNQVVTCEGCGRILYQG
ncbi:MAG TPA: hypothetical protein GX714_07235 [Chloroflexi bacterium]|jgi:predicted  nucleic acid-binding Zn-ribbon protein|nr:hypothetical protein [Chloroflexota bacterium]